MVVPGRLVNHDVAESSRFQRLTTKLVANDDPRRLVKVDVAVVESARPPMAGSPIESSFDRDCASRFEIAESALDRFGWNVHNGGDRAERGLEHTRLPRSNTGMEDKR